MSPVEASAPARPPSPDYAGILRIPAVWNVLARGHRGGRRLCNADSCLLRSRFLHALSSAWVFRLFGKQKSFPSARWRKAHFMQCGGPRHQYFSKRPGRCAAGLIRNSFPQSTSAGAQGKISHAPVDSGFPGIQAQRMLLRSVLHLLVGSGGCIWQNAGLRPWNRFQRAALMHLGFDAAFCAFRKCADHAPQKLFGCAQSIGKGKRRADSSLPC